jgi:flagellar secretion chaperone FliS
MTNSNAYAAYRSAEVETVSQKELIIRLYQGAERFLSAGRIAMENKRGEEAMNHCQRARDIFVELMSTLNFEGGGEVANQLKELYSFLIFQISEASLRKNPEQLLPLMPIIKTLREGWEAIPEEHSNLSSIPVENAGHSFNFRC